MSHRVVEEWRGDVCETLADLLCPGLCAVCIGVNPAPRSVEVGHYYQGRLGQTFFARLRRGGLLPEAPGWEDDTALAAGIGFTDIVKRPTVSATEISVEELNFGRPIVIAKLATVQPQLALFVFKKAAVVLLGPFDGFGFIGKELAGAEVFVMPGPYERGDRVAAALDELAAWWRARS